MGKLITIILCLCLITPAFCAIDGGRRDESKNIAVCTTLQSAARTATATGTTVNIAAYGAAAFVVPISAFSGTGVYTVTFQESADDSTWTAIHGDNLIGTADSVIADSTLDISVTPAVIGYVGKQPYIRALATETSGSATATFSVHVLQLEPFVRPLR